MGRPLELLSINEGEMSSLALQVPSLEAARLAALVAGIEAELDHAVANANETRTLVLGARALCSSSYADYGAAAQMVTTAKNIHFKLAVRSCCPMFPVLRHVAHAPLVSTQREHDVLLRQIKENRAWLLKARGAHDVVHDKVAALTQSIGERQRSVPVQGSRARTLYDSTKCCSEHAAQVSEARVLEAAGLDAAAELALCEEKATASAAAVAKLVATLAAQQEAVQVRGCGLSRNRGL